MLQYCNNVRSSHKNPSQLRYRLTMKTNNMVNSRAYSLQKLPFTMIHKLFPTLMYLFQFLTYRKTTTPLSRSVCLCSLLNGVQFYILQYSRKILHIHTVPKLWEKTSYNICHAVSNQMSRADCECSLDDSDFKHFFL